MGPTELDHNHQRPIRINETKTSQTNHPTAIHCDVASTDFHQASVADGVLETQIQWSYRITPRAPLSFPAEGGTVPCRKRMAWPQDSYDGDPYG